MSFGPDEMSPQSACRLEPDRLPFETLQRFLLSLQTAVCLERSIRSVLLPKRSLAQKKSMSSSMNVNRSCHVVPQVEFSAEDRGSFILQVLGWLCGRVGHAHGMPSDRSSPSSGILVVGGFNTGGC
ncbi:hypothetical protein RO3G_10650 [Rhizopus delemar RA 99-880]|uniref:Uncharacterized protein n=1 Tax=Rhizopus delemar (strain RA 99-880 / ATCC MYA-4621 / FGSC 9543 / NRRL 43880) TaxID=246409 RepID=I1CBW0_RHIO9|nr:hypothetical protein RO3G_10650 [Rhizopus delemar RA 99-880]|eukprot:EIE85940.1 hypothetical protein RO3G_10650 [Rhizopus delemar RA 99-880]